MALRPLVFGARLKDKNRSVRVRAAKGRSGGYVVEETRSGKTRRRDHGSLQGALHDLASSWRGRLH
ncbi:MAG: hypothetical protein ACQGVC_24985 [Myxococcota bacterium]